METALVAFVGASIACFGIWLFGDRTSGLDSQTEGAVARELPSKRHGEVDAHVRTTVAEEGRAAPTPPSAPMPPDERPLSREERRARSVTNPALTVPRLDGIEASIEEPPSDIALTLITRDGRTALPARAIPILFDEDAAPDASTPPDSPLVLSASGKTNAGLKRKENQDRVLLLRDEGVFVVADGMGGHKGGAIASQLAVDTISYAYTTSPSVEDDHDALPSAASKLANSIQRANLAIHLRAECTENLAQMGTTVSAALFSPTEHRLYVGHVGDSRVYRWRSGDFRQMTADHTMVDFGATGRTGAQLSRAVGVWPTVPIDVLIAKPLAGDVYLICSDGLTKMVDDAAIEGVLGSLANPATNEELERGVDELIALANARGGRDNVTVLLVGVSACAPAA